MDMESHVVELLDNGLPFCRAARQLWLTFCRAVRQNDKWDSHFVELLEKMGLDQLQRQLHQHLHAYSTQQQPDDSDNDADEGDDNGKKSKGNAQKEAQRPAISITTRGSKLNFLSIS